MSISVEHLPDLLTRHQVSVDRGFLPSTDPALRLPALYQPWESVAQNLSILLKHAQVREKIDALPVLSVGQLEKRAEQELALVILAILGHAYVYGEGQKSAFVPAPIAVPWLSLCEILGRLPIIQHANMVLYNWRLKDPNGPFVLDNLRTLYGFHKSKDEEAFFLVTVLVEKAGAKALSAACQAWLSAQENQIASVADSLSALSEAIQEMSKALEQMFETCDPEVFYHEIRPFVDSFDQIEFKGIQPRHIRSYHGGSAAQSTLFPLLDAVLGVEHASTYLQTMRAYMPREHSALVSHIEQGPSLSDFCMANAELKKLRDEALAHLTEFRNLHLKIVAIYIMGPARKAGQSSRGTGGTNPMIFLKEVRDHTEEAKK